jgi:hypothetical protein
MVDTMYTPTISHTVLLLKLFTTEAMKTKLILA